MRRYTSGALSIIAFYEMSSDIPDDIREHPVIRELETLAVDLIVISNISSALASCSTASLYSGALTYYCDRMCCHIVRSKPLGMKSTTS